MYLIIFQKSLKSAPTAFGINSYILGMNGFLIYFYLVAILVAIVGGFLLLYYKKNKPLAITVLVVGLSLLIALMNDIIFLS